MNICTFFGEIRVLNASERSSVPFVFLSTTLTSVSFTEPFFGMVTFSVGSTNVRIM